MYRLIVTANPYECVVAWQLVLGGLPMWQPSILGSSGMAVKIIRGAMKLYNIIMKREKNQNGYDLK